jgi:hypothetical protein
MQTTVPKANVTASVLESHFHAAGRSCGTARMGLGQMEPAF